MVGRFDADGDGHIDAGEWREMGMKLGTWSGMTPLAAVRPTHNLLESLWDPVTRQISYESPGAI